MAILKRQQLDKEIEMLIASLQAPPEVKTGILNRLKAAGSLTPRPVPQAPRAGTLPVTATRGIAQGIAAPVQYDRPPVKAKRTLAANVGNPRMQGITVAEAEERYIPGGPVTGKNMESYFQYLGMKKNAQGAYTPAAAQLPGVTEIRFPRPLRYPIR